MSQIPPCGTVSLNDKRHGLGATAAGRKKKNSGTINDYQSMMCAYRYIPKKKGRKGEETTLKKRILVREVRAVDAGKGRITTDDA